MQNDDLAPALHVQKRDSTVSIGWKVVRAARLSTPEVGRGGTLERASPERSGADLSALPLRDRALRCSNRDRAAIGRRDMETRRAAPGAPDARRRLRSRPRPDSRAS